MFVEILREENGGKEEMPKKLGKTPENSEYNEQVTVFAWAALMEPKHPELCMLSSSLNGVRLSIGAATKAKRAGLRAGFPDIFLAVARNGYHGLFIEMKKVGGRKPEPAQQVWLHNLATEGYACFCCKGADAAIKTIGDYLGMKGDKNGPRQAKSMPT